MNKILNEAGNWFLPNNNEMEFVGKLKINNEGTFELEITQILNEGKTKDILQNTEEIILGQVGTSLISLFNCQCVYKSFERDGSGNKINKYNYHCRFVFKGKHYTNQNEVIIKKINFSFKNLNQWMGNDHLDLGKQDNNIYTISYSKPHYDKFELNDSFLNIKSKTSRHMEPFKVILKENFWFELIFKEEKSWGYVLSQIQIFEEFFELAMDESTKVEKLNIEINKGNNNSNFIDIFFSNFNLIIPEIRDNRRMLFTFSDLNGEFGKILNNWFEKRNFYLNFFKLYFLNINTEMTFETQTILYAQELESYIRDNPNIKDTYLSKEAYLHIQEKLTKNIKSLVLGNDHKDSLINKIKYGSEYSFRKRLKELLKSLNEITIINEISEGNISNFADIIADTRNYYIHSSKENKVTVKKDRDLFVLNYKLEFLVITCFLKELGFDESKINKIMDKKYKKHQIVFEK